MTKKDEKREKGTIASAELMQAHGIPTVSVMIDFGGGCQGFGGIALQDADIRDSFIADLCATFGVGSLDDLKGLGCHALRCWGHWNDTIEGLEAGDGRRFVLSAWRRKMGFDDDPLERRRRSIEQSIASLRSRLEEERRAIAVVADGYTDWGREPKGGNND